MKNILKILLLLFYFLVLINLSSFVFAECNITQPDCSINWTNGCDVRSSMTPPPGMYVFPFGIDVCADHITFDCQGATTLSGNEDFVGVHLNSTDGVAIKNCEVRSFSTAIFIVSSKDTVINQNKLKANDHNGVLIRESKNTLLSDNEMSFNSDGVRVDDVFGGSSVTIKDNNISRNFIGIEIGRNSNGTIITNNNIMSNQLGSGIGIFLDVSNNISIMKNNISSNTQTGIRIQRSSNINILDNKIKLNGENGVRILSGTTTSTNNKIINNNIESNNRDAIFFFGAKNSTIEKNIINKSGGNGINLTLGSTSNNISDNVIDSNTNNGVVIMEGSSSNRVINNAISNNGLNGIAVGLITFISEKNNFTGNIIFNNKKAGVKMNSSSSNNLINNTIINNEEEGIRVLSSKLNRINNNTIQNNSLDGISLFKSSLNNMTYNNISDNVDGISLTKSNNNTVINNTLFFDRIYLTDSNFNIIKDSEVTKSFREGIYLNNSNSNELIRNEIEDTFFLDPAILIENSKFNKLLNNFIFDNNRDGIVLLNSSKTIIESNRLFLNDKSIFLNNSNQNTIKSNTLDGRDEDIFLENSGLNTIQSNTLEAGGKSAKILRSHSNSFTQNTIEDGLNSLLSNLNIFTSNLMAGSNFNSSNDTLIDSNFIGRLNIVDSYRNIVKFNDVNDGALLANSSKNIIEKNDFTSSIRDGVILLGSEDNKIKFNNIESNSLNGIFLSNSRFNNLLSNNIKSNQKNGIKISDSDSNFISFNTLDNNFDDGVEISIDSDSNSLTGNVIIKNNDNGISVEGLDSDSETIFFNYVCFNQLDDFNMDNLIGHIGDENNCDKPDGWNDAGTFGCTFSCMFDFGDAPDPTYPSLLSSDGARHHSTAFEFLGDGVSVETDAKIINQDEFDDGVSFPILKPFSNTSLNITITVFNKTSEKYNDTFLYLSGWFDWNNDGQWSENERAFMNIISPFNFTNDKETIKVNFITPLITKKSIWARIRLSYKDPTNVTGGSAFGEVEDYLVNATILNIPPKKFPPGDKNKTKCRLGFPC